MQVFDKDKLEVDFVMCNSGIEYPINAPTLYPTITSIDQFFQIY